ncbi:MAG TPA: hypothetical protein PKL31_14445 [Fulvivirga sp.]|nr:hypothetical protein [Fulvivirga sp.]
MELEELKEQIADSQVSYSRSELKEIFTLRTKRTVSKINRKMLIDALLMILTTALLVAATFIIGLRSRYVVSGQIIGFSLLIFVHYRIKSVLIKKAQNSDNGLQIGAEKLVRILNKYIYAYKIILPSFFSILTIKHYYDLTHNWSAVSDHWLIIIIAAVTGYIAANITAKMIYGKELNKLKKIIEAMDWTD